MSSNEQGLEIRAGEHGASESVTGDSAITELALIALQARVEARAARRPTELFESPADRKRRQLETIFARMTGEPNAPEGAPLAAAPTPSLKDLLSLAKATVEAERRQP